METRQKWLLQRTVDCSLKAGDEDFSHWRWSFELTRRKTEVVSRASQR
jgi:hypothetical protein